MRRSEEGRGGRGGVSPGVRGGMIYKIRSSPQHCCRFLLVSIYRRLKVAINSWTILDSLN